MEEKNYDYSNKKSYNGVAPKENEALVPFLAHEVLKNYHQDIRDGIRKRNEGIIEDSFETWNIRGRKILVGFTAIPKDQVESYMEGFWKEKDAYLESTRKKRSSSVSAIYFHPRSACGEMFRRIHWNNRGCKSIVWRCISRLEPTGQECHARIVNEMVLENVVVQAINTLLGDKSTYQAQLQQNIAKVIRSAQQKTADGIDERLQELQKELLKKANNKEAYDEIADEIFKLREQ